MSYKEGLQELIEQENPKRLLSEADQLVDRFAMAEYRVVRRYFEQPPMFRTDERDLKWMRLQIAKEGFQTQDADERMRKLSYMHKHLQIGYWDGSVANQDILELLQKMKEEYYHSDLFAKLAEKMSGQYFPANTSLLVGPHRQIGEARVAIIGELGERLGEAVNGFVEVGRGSMFLALAHVKEGKLAAEIARAGQIIYDQEVGHFTKGGKEPLEKLAPEITKPAWQSIFGYIHQTGRLRLNMRNDQFSYPNTEAEIVALVNRVEEKTIEPLDPSKL